MTHTELDTSAADRGATAPPSGRSEEEAHDRRGTGAAVDRGTGDARQPGAAEGGADQPGAPDGGAERGVAADRGAGQVGAPDGDVPGPGASDGGAVVVDPRRSDGQPVARLGGDAGMATAEYAVALVAAVGFAGLLVVILSSGEVRELLLGIVRSALSV